MIWTSDDSLILGLVFGIAIGLRWVIFSGPGWGRTLLKFLVVPAIMVVYKLSKGGFWNTTFVIFGTFLFAFVCVWLAKWPLDWLAYLYRVMRGAAKTAKKKADAMADVE